MSKGSHTERVSWVFKTLKENIDKGLYSPGARFLSARDLSHRYELSYQTADRLLTELAKEGRLIRRPKSGTYVAGKALTYQGLQLLLPKRANEIGTFSHEMRRHLEPMLQAIDGYDLKVEAAQLHKLHDDMLPIMWMADRAAARCIAAGRRGILINEHPRVMIADLFDAVGLDNAVGGAIAADALVRMFGRRSKLMVLAGPKHDERSLARAHGFSARAGWATVIHAGGWLSSHGERWAARIAREEVDGLFCANDRLAEGVITWLQKQKRRVPAVIGFDNAPIAKRLGLSTVAIPWQSFAEEVRLMAERRLNDPGSPRRRVDLVPQLVVRKLAASE
ncbi:substrate-binding domain-containing protein [Poriferisphaera corsica]|nr:substrate-binding domain-containing protein [Poriferisphaera corsica]